MELIFTLRKLALLHLVNYISGFVHNIKKTDIYKYRLYIIFIYTYLALNKIIFIDYILSIFWLKFNI